MSMFSDYIHERTNDLVIETDKGFATYRYVDQETVYIVDIYVKPDFRKSGEASNIADVVRDAAKKQGCKKMLGSVVPSSKGSTTSLKVLLGYGMIL